MARVTVEDCIDKVPNRFGLVLLSAHRARAISAGGQILVDRDNDKNPVVALREVADDVVDPEELKDARWFTRDQMRNCDQLGFQLPRADSIARRLIEDWLAHG